jgi:diguanylate cyclase (GGDEF)-like protein/PAS domain S-box-containing protein
MPHQSNPREAAAEDRDLRARLEKAEASLREIYSGESDALFVSSQAGAQLFTLRGADESYRTLIENMSEGALTLTRQGIILYANRRFAKMLGSPLEKVMGSDIHAWVAAESRQDLQTLLREETADNRRADLALAAADGTRVPVHLSVSPLVLDGVPDFFCMVATDLTEQKRNEAVLAAEVLARAILEQAADAIVICDASGAIIRASKQAQALHGRDPRGHLFQDVFALRRADGSAFPPIGTIDTGGRGSIEARLQRDGEELELLVTVGHLKSARNELFGSVITLTDITERKRSEQDLRESERRFSDLLGNVALISVMRDREERITYANEFLLHLTGWQREEIAGRSWIDVFVPPEIVERKQALFASLLLNKPEAWHHESEILTRSGERRLIRWNNSVLRSGAGDVIGTASIGEDITQERRAETSLKRLNRVYAVLSGINALIMRVRNRRDLFKEACRIAVEVGGFRMAVIGIVDRGAMKIVPAGMAGAGPEFLAALEERFSLAGDEPLGNTIPARVIREKRIVVVNDLRIDPQIVFGKQYVEWGVHSMAVLPLVVCGEAVGMLVLYANPADFFLEEEMKLLTELTGNIAFAIDYLDNQTQLDYLAYYDVLTGLANRTLFLDRVAQYMRSAVLGGHKLAVFMIDLERFKSINDSLGQAAGDLLLRQVGEWLGQYAGDPNLVARLGADHFATVLPQLKLERSGARILEKSIRDFMDHPFRLNDVVYHIAIKVGVAVFPDDGTGADALFKNAEAALKKAKTGSERYLFYTPEINEAVAGALTMENRLHEALENEEFVLHYQPKVNLSSGKVAGAEALIRWNDPHTGLVPPGRFISILEETGMIHPVGRWALHQAVADYLRWRAAGLPAVRIAVNVSPLQLRNHGFVDEVRGVIGISAHAAQGLELEITESVIMEDIEHNIATLGAIRAMGLSVAIDDFGTGFSSLAYLAKLPVDALKIDRSFVIDMTAGPQGLALVSTIVSLAHSLKLKVVAEGVETDEQSRLLHLLNCDETQGFLFSKAVPAAEFEARFLAPAAAPGAPG